MTEELKVGDQVELTFGPFASRWQVSEIIPNGARLSYMGGVHFVGFGRIQYAPNGDQLTANWDQAFVGGAHLHSLKRLEVKD